MRRRILQAVAVAALVFAAITILTGRQTGDRRTTVYPNTEMAALAAAAAGALVLARKGKEG